MISDLHAGHGSSDFATPGFDDRLADIPEEASWARYDREAVRKINALASGHRLRFVVVTGDITQSAERSEFEAAKRILDELEVPYLPLPGNHDVWPYTNAESAHEGSEAPGPIGDRYFEEVFAETFARAKALLPDLARSAGPVWNPEAKVATRFQNFAFSYQGYGFIGLDWNSRQSAPGPLLGAPAQAQLSDFAGGTFQWLEDRVRSGWAARQKQVFTFQHHPFRTLVPDWLFAFSRGEKAKVRELLGLVRVWGVFAGHTHHASDRPAFDETASELAAFVPPSGPAMDSLRDAAQESLPERPAITVVAPRSDRFRQVVTASAFNTAQVTIAHVFEDGSVLIGRY